MPAPTAVASVLNPWPARWPQGDRANSNEYPMDAAAVFVAGAPVFEGAGDDIEECGADPALILGFAAENAEGVLRAGFCNVYIADEHTQFGGLLVNGSSATIPPTAAHLHQSYGITKFSGTWYIDVAKTGGSARVFIMDWDKTGNRNVVFFKVLAANRQYLG